MYYFILIFQGTNFEIIGDEKTMDVYCNAEDDHGDVSFREYVDVSGLTFTVADDLETLLYNGDVKILKDLPPGPITMEIDVFRWQRSQWLPTLISLKRDNFCKALMNPRELWHSVVKTIPKEQLKCPPNKGHIYTVTNVSNHLFVKNMPFVDVVGDLKAVAHLGVGEHKTCAVVFFKVYAN
ncbi:hypothetical protein KR054_010251 [Drosophila jambulina]|nr:hypothetical protein KR054_010251 [Drosophila jambulina]